MRIVSAFFFVFILVGCETENPLCTDNYCVEGRVFLKSDLDANQKFDGLPANIDEEKLINLLTVDVGEYDFEPITVSGTVDWDLQSEDWKYRENGVSYLKKVILEITSDQGRFGENRIILVQLNNDTVEIDKDWNEFVDFLGTASIKLTHHIGIATYKGDILGAPTK